MNTIPVLTLGLSLAFAGVSHAQQARTDTSTFSSSVAASGAPIHVRLPGGIVLHAWEQARIEGRVIDEISGRVVGYSNGRSRAAYAVDVTVTDRGIIIAPRQRATRVVIGYSTIQERVRHEVYLPSTARICIDDDGNDLTIDGRFSAMDVAPRSTHVVKLRDDKSLVSLFSDCAAGT